jgi:hypothetical protein
MYCSNNMATYTNDAMSYTNDTNESYQENVQYLQPASPTNQETTTVHHIPLQDGMWDQTYETYYETDFTPQPNYFPDQTSTGYYSPYMNQVEQRRWAYPSPFELQWEPTPILSNSRNNQAMKQFMQRNSGGGCIVMQPTQRERVATPRSDYLQRYHPQFTELQVTLPEEQSCTVNDTYNVYINEQTDCSLGVPEMGSVPGCQNEHSKENISHTLSSVNQPLECHQPEANISQELPRETDSDNEQMNSKYDHNDTNNDGRPTLKTQNSRELRTKIVEFVYEYENAKACSDSSEDPSPLS